MHNFGGYTGSFPQELRLTNCQELSQDLTDVNEVDSLTCNSFSSQTLPNCFQGCNNNDLLLRATFSSIMDYALLHNKQKAYTFPSGESIKIMVLSDPKGSISERIDQLSESTGKTTDQIRQDIITELNRLIEEGKSKEEMIDALEEAYFSIGDLADYYIIGYGNDLFNLIECTECLKAIGVENAESNCNDLPDILASNNFRCRDALDCIAIYGDCSTTCNSDTGNCEVDVGKECILAYPPQAGSIWQNSDFSIPLTDKVIMGNCNGQGVCIAENTVDCVKNSNSELLSEPPRNLMDDCVNGCNDDNTWNFNDGRECYKFRSGEVDLGMCAQGTCAKQEGWECLGDSISFCDNTLNWCFSCTKDCEDHKCVPYGSDKTCSVTKDGVLIVGRCGIDDKKGQCVSDPSVECSYITDCKQVLNWDKSCTKDCTDNKCIPDDPGDTCFISLVPLEQGKCGRKVSDEEDYTGKCVKEEETHKWKEE